MKGAIKRDSTEEPFQQDEPRPNPRPGDLHPQIDYYCFDCQSTRNEFQSVRPERSQTHLHLNGWYQE